MIKGFLRPIRSTRKARMIRGMLTHLNGVDENILMKMKVVTTPQAPERPLIIRVV
jgi:hypothetical protein